MTGDEKNEQEHAHGEMIWDDLPRELRVLVYEHLKEAVAKARKDASFAQVLHNVATKDPRTVGPIQTAHAAVAEAFELALEELTALDREICHDCGEFLDTHVEGHAPRDPKDLS